MKSGFGALLAAIAIAMVIAVGCGKLATSSSEAIQHAQTLKTPARQADYLVNRAKAFVDSEDYQEAIQTAQYVLLSVDSRSQAAKDLLEQAKSKLATNTQAIVGEAKKQGL